jgi:hypothetical protein
LRTPYNSECSEYNAYLSRKNISYQANLYKLEREPTIFLQIGNEKDVQLHNLHNTHFCGQNKLDHMDFPKILAVIYNLGKTHQLLHILW